MAFVRIRTIKGRQYRYREERWREGGKVRSRSTCLGPVEGGEEMGFIRRQFGKSYGVDWDAIARQQLDRMKAEDERRATFLADLHQAFGLKLGPAMPVPEEKVAAPPSPAPAQAQEVQEDASPDGEAGVQ